MILDWYMTRGWWRLKPKQIFDMISQTDANSAIMIDTTVREIWFGLGEWDKNDQKRFSSCIGSRWTCWHSHVLSLFARTLCSLHYWVVDHSDARRTGIYIYIICGTAGFKYFDSSTPKPPEWIQIDPNWQTCSGSKNEPAGFVETAGTSLALVAGPGRPTARFHWLALWRGVCLLYWKCLQVCSLQMWKQLFGSYSEIPQPSGFQPQAAPPMAQRPVRSFTSDAPETQVALHRVEGMMACSGGCVP